MGTNYYFTKPKCPHCGHQEEGLHIGKSSCGWCFSLHVIPEEGINSLDDWEHHWKTHKGQIVDEYGDSMAIDEMLGIIVDRNGVADFSKPLSDSMHWAGIHTWEDFHQTNHCQPGPRGLLRHKIGDHCVGHGPGTWDLINSDFS